MNRYSLSSFRFLLDFLLCLLFVTSIVCAKEVNQEAPTIPLDETSSQATTPPKKRMLASQATHPKICLTMIVKNESKIIERCLDSVKDVVDCISICDTGSTDNTVSIIESYLKRHQIPGKVHRHEWKNFGHNRTASVVSAQKMLLELGIPLYQTYLLFFDADMLLVKDAKFTKKELQYDAYNLVQKSDDLTYYNLRLARASLPWNCVGVTHEYWASDIPHREGQLATLMIDDREDGGCKTDKFERDVKLLTQGLKDEPENERYMFYLGQSYKCLEQYDDAILWYEARIKKGGWKEEVYYSMLQIGVCFEAKKDWDNARQWYLKAYQFHPARAETLYMIAKYYRINGQYDLAYSFAKEGKKIPFPERDILFVMHSVYDYQFDEEISIAAYYTPFKEEGFRSLSKILLNKEVPETAKLQAYSNLQFYVENLDRCIFKPIDLKLPPLKTGMPETFRPLNPSIVQSKEGYDLMCRTVNFVQKGGKSYVPLDTDDPFKGCITRNFLIHYDRDFKVQSQAEIVEKLNRPRINSYLSRHVKGLEDARLFRFKDQLWFSCTTFDTSPHERQISLCKISEKEEEAEVDRLIPLLGPDPRRCEKNWLPFVHQEEIQFIYSYDPFKIVKPDLSTGKLETVIEYEPKYDFSQFRGSAGPIVFDDGYLVIVHEVIFDDQRYYVHRFLFLDKNFQVKKISKPFTFKHLGIEYVCGMTMNHEKTQVVISLGLEDSEASLAFVDAAQVREMLEPLE